MVADVNNDNGNLVWIYQFELPQQCCNRCIEGTHRYVIGAFKKYPPDPKKVLICIGLNPNTGIPCRLEDTVQAINDFAFGNKIKANEREKIKPWPSDGWIMLNLSPIRFSEASSLPSALDMMSETDRIAHERNKKIIKLFLDRYPDAVRLAAWGDEITEKDKDYLRETFYEFTTEEEKKRKWYCCCLTSEKDTNDGLTKNAKNPNPRHPYKKIGQSWGKKLGDTVINEFVISRYQTKLEKRFPQKSYEKSTINTKST